MTNQTLDKPAHTAGPWSVGPYGGIYPVNANEHGGPMIVSATTKSGRLPNHAANERHIAACVNALEGINPDAIADVVAALRGLENAAAYVSQMGATTGPQWPTLSFALIKARAAISKATSQDAQS
jgi:hypothetical protein